MTPPAPTFGWTRCPVWRGRGGLALVAALAALSIGELAAQALTAIVNGDAVHVRAPSLKFLQGDVLGRLRDGRSVPIDVRLDILARRDGAALASAEQSFTISFDLWEERFAVTRVGQPPRSVTHLTSAAAEAWCLDNVTVPVTALGANRSAPLWIRMALRIHNEPPVRESDGDSPFSIRRLIDTLSRRSPAEEPARILEAGPIRLTN